MTEKAAPDDTLPSRFSDLWRLDVHFADIPWRPFAEGVDIFPLRQERDGAVKAALLRNAPGAMVEMHRHQGYEYLLVLSGQESDENGDYDAGTLVINPPGSCHQVRSHGGNIVLAIWEKPVVFLSQR